MTVRSAATTLHRMAYCGEPSRRMMNSDTDSHIWNNIEGAKPQQICDDK